MKELSGDSSRQFTGSETWYRHGINRKVLFTDGAKRVADQLSGLWQKTAWMLRWSLAIPRGAILALALPFLIAD